MGSKAPQENPNPGAAPVLSPPPPNKRSDVIELNGISFRADEIKSVTIERNGTEIYIPRAEQSKKTGFANH